MTMVDSQYVDDRCATLFMGFPEEHYDCGYYIARPDPEVGVCIYYSDIQAGYVAQLFPWMPDSNISAVKMYTAMIVDLANSIEPEMRKIYRRYPQIGSCPDLLMLKACIIDALERRKNDLDQSRAADC